MKTNLALILIGVLVGGCEIVPPYSQVDFGKTAEGKTYLLDTARTWAEMQETLDRHIKDEASRLKPQGGADTWTIFWLNAFSAWRAGSVENPEKYVTYIVQRRRKLGLSEIE